jgi:hypothetical protein
LLCREKVRGTDFLYVGNKGYFSFQTPSHPTPPSVDSIIFFARDRLTPPHPLPGWESTRLVERASGVQRGEQDRDGGGRAVRSKQDKRVVGKVRDSFIKETRKQVVA